MEYKKVIKIVPWCKQCQQEIQGNGSIVYPYKCNCGEWKYNEESFDYILTNQPQ